jgi:4-aminobutyrate aminotransferase-like enzyme
MEEETGLQHACRMEPETGPRVETRWRRIQTALPVPESLPLLARIDAVTPAVNCYQPPIVWERAEGFQVHDAHGNRWIDFTSTAVMTNSGHGHPRIRQALREHLEDGLLAQFSFASEIRTRLSEKLVQIAPASMDQAYLWTTGSETIECAFRLAREWGSRIDPAKTRLASIAGDYHGCTLAAHQLSGPSAEKPWNPDDPSHIHRLPFPGEPMPREPGAWDEYVRQAIAATGSDSSSFAALVIETLQGWGALELPGGYVHALRRWADEHQVLIVFDEIQTGFGRTGKWFAHEHYGVEADMICIGKGLTSTLPLAAVLGRSEVLDLLPPGLITSTHSGHPLSCVAALANLEIIHDERLVEHAAAMEIVVTARLEELQQKFPRVIRDFRGRGLMHAVDIHDPATGEASPSLARDLTWEIVRRGVMMFYTNRPTLKIVPPLVISKEALLDGIDGIEEALESLPVAR